MIDRIACAAAAVLLLGLSGGERFSIPAMQAIIDVSGAVVSADGSYVAYVSSKNVLDRNTSVDSLHVYDLKHRQDRVAAFDHESYSDLQWSPDDKLAFVADDAETKNDQVFVTSSRLDRERRLTAGASDVLEIAWRRDGNAIAFLRREKPAPKSGAEKFADAFEVGDNAYLASKAAQPAHLWTVDEEGLERRVTSGTWSIRDATISWSADDRYVLYERVPNGIYGDRDRSVIERVDVVSGERQPLTGKRALENQGVYSPDGRTIAFLYPRDGLPQNETEISQTSVSGGATLDVTRSLDRHVEDFAWYDSKHVLARVFDRTRTRLDTVDLAGHAAELPTGDVTSAEIDALQSVSSSGDVVFTGSTPDHPNELYLLVRGAAKPERLTSFNAAIDSLELGRETEMSWTNGGFREYGVLTYPPGYDPHRRYPLLLRIHGGPTETSTTAFEPFYQLAAARGYLVLAPNYRGSSSYGNAFESAIFNDASVGPGTDIMAAVAAAQRANPIDRTRIGVSGWSYGGQLTTWMTAKYHIWKAAVSGAAVNDLVVDSAIADDYDDDRNAFSIPPRGNGAWVRQSPISFAGAIATPTLILCNVYDVRVPIVESYELFRALRDRGVPVKFYAYPTGGHLPSGPVRLGDAYQKWLDWMDSYLSPTR